MTQPTGYSAALILEDALRPRGVLGEEAPDPTALERSALSFIQRLRSSGIRTALMTMDRGSTGIGGEGEAALFDLVTDGGDQPLAKLLQETAQRLEVTPRAAIVVTASAVMARAARAAGFGLVVGINHNASRQQLEDAGAMTVVNDLSELDIGVSRTDPWILAFDGFDPVHEGHREVLTASGNGYLGFRSVYPERHDDGVHYPGTYIAGVFNRTLVDFEGEQAEEEHLVNLPNWLPFDVRLGDGPWWSQQQERSLTEHRRLDLRRGLLTRSVTLEGPGGGGVEVVQRSFASMDDPHLVAMETVLTPRGWSGRVRIRVGIDAAIRNGNTGAPVTTHLGPATFTVAADALICQSHTLQSDVQIAVAVRSSVHGIEGVVRDLRVDTTAAAEEFDMVIGDGQPVRVVRIGALVTSRDRAIASATEGASAVLRRHTAPFDDLLRRHEMVWERLWGLFEVRVQQQPDAQLMLNLHLFHLLQAISPHTTRIDAGVPARGLNGEGYRGHIFWDEMFVLPVLGQRNPEITRGLLDYRWRRLDAAREAARTEGNPGAQFPWQSGSDGREETPIQLYNPRSQRWMPDNSSRQRHVGLAVAFEAWQHVEATGDLQWLATRGAELMVEIGRYFSALARWESADDRFHIDGVMGPDEYHDGYPERPGEGLRDNTYTNVLAAWLFARLADARQLLQGHRWDDVADRLGVTDEEIQRWERLRARLAVPFHEDGIVSQFAGYDELAEFDWDGYRRRYGNIGRLDLILQAEGDATNRYKLSKQADVLMLVYLLGADGLVDQLAELGYDMTRDDLRRTLEYYTERTSHGSTLSRVVHASVWAGFDPAHSWDLFREALVADLDDTQGGTTRHGVHLGAMAGTADIVVRSFAGLTLRDGDLAFCPCLPDHLPGVSFTIRHRGHRISVTVTHAELAVHSAPTTVGAIGARLAGRRYDLTGGSTVTIPYGTHAEEGQ
ncbi:glycoside hydrolase family 65 protein [Microbacterium aurantiacum]|uniref:glycoside hydrolase family 65 protein n=1 Tax=Microbacterium aurantiacum TaxID=162393 RepID=UPI004035B94A